MYYIVYAYTVILSLSPWKLLMLSCTHLRAMAMSRRP